jgi:protein gp37
MHGKEQNPLHLDEKELKTNLGTGNFIFVCSGCDLFHPDVSDEWIIRVLAVTDHFPQNKYLLHTKNPQRVNDFSDWLDDTYTLCTTIESDLIPTGISNAPTFGQRIDGLQKFKGHRMITIEPILEFGSPASFASCIHSCYPCQVNIGADSGHNHLPEPSPEKIAALIEALRPFTKVELKDNLRRILPESRYYESA